jgi:hypothetical protein
VSLQSARRCVDPSTHLRRNRETRDFWSAYAGHRRRISSLIRDRAPSDGTQTLCALGAGNCNDLDLAELCQRFARVTLIDLDVEAVRDGLERQQLSATARARIDVQPLDLLAEVDAEQRYSVVLSSCVLSQLVLEAARQSDDPAAWLAVRKKHVLDLLSMTEDGGAALLVTDFVSSETVPDLVAYPEARLAELVPALVRQRNHFLGLSPEMLDELITSDAMIAALASMLGRRRLWRWDWVERAYLVVAYSLRKRALLGRALTGGDAL